MTRWRRWRATSESGHCAVSLQCLTRIETSVHLLPVLPPRLLPAHADAPPLHKTCNRYPEFKGSVAAVYTHPLENTPGSSGAHYGKDALTCKCSRSLCVFERKPQKKRLHRHERGAGYGPGYGGAAERRAVSGCARVDNGMTDALSTSEQEQHAALSGFWVRGPSSSARAAPQIL